MLLDRRQFVTTIGAAALGVHDIVSGQSKMYGLIGKLRTQPGQRDALIAILIAGTGSMPGCLSYVVAKDPAGRLRSLEFQAGGRGQWAFLSRFRRDPRTGVLQVESR